MPTSINVSPMETMAFHTPDDCDDEDDDEDDELDEVEMNEEPSSSSVYLNNKVFRQEQQQQRSRRQARPEDWRLRDAAQNLVEDRQELMTLMSSLSPRVNTNVTEMPLLSRRFDTEAAVNRLTIEQGRLPLIFDMAAACVLEAIQNQKVKEESDDSDDEDDDDSATDDEDKALPRALQDIRQLQELRIQSLERSHENKDFAKRKSTQDDGGSQATTSFTKTVKHEEDEDTNTKPVNNTTSNASVTTTTNSKPEPPPKFTRNTPASSAAALDFRFNSSRAILCTAGNIAFEALTPGPDVDILAVPQNNAAKQVDYDDNNDDDDTNDGESNTGSTDNNNTNTTAGVNMGAVVLEAQILGQRAISVVQNAVRRATLRYRYRKDNALEKRGRRHHRDDENSDREFFLKLANPFQWSNRTRGMSLESEFDLDADADEDDIIPYNPNHDSITQQWQSLCCLPRFLSILKKGAGHAIYHDLEWSSRHGRIADLLRHLKSSTSELDHDADGNFGPHLIITTQPEVSSFCQEFHDLNAYLGLVTTNESGSLRVLPYQGSKIRRRQLRQYFPQATGLPEAPFHVLVTSYATFFEDYLHFSQLPFETVVLDDGMGWMAAAQGDQNSSLRSIWDTAIFSSNDQHIGLAGTPTFKHWDYSLDAFPEHIVKEARVGLTARHRIVTASSFSTHQRTNLEVVSVSCLVNFLTPHFSDVVREEWDRSRIASDVKSMKHFRKLVARSTVVHTTISSTMPSNTMSDDDVKSMSDYGYRLAVQALTGKLGAADRSQDPHVPRVVPDEEFVSSGKVSSSRRWTLAWLGRRPEQSWLRFELGCAKFEPILDVMKLSNNHGHFCEEITTASSTTSSGASGQVAGTMAYRLAVCCGRHFGSEQGLRQHVSALHAPPGTWLCRTCSTDCVTSQARTHHERSCGQPTNGVGEDATGSGGATPIVGQGGGPKSGVGKKKGGRPGAALAASTTEEKDSDGSFRVPGYRGVWINTAGKHFVKVDGERVFEEEGKDENVLLFDNVDDAGRKYDDEVKKRKKKKNQKLELNFKPDGSRIVYEDITPASTSGLGGSAANVVPALSVINIKDLPPDVKPLLRDPRQTSRTGGNSKRHVYAYRGVCRQARKGHDRWQSQISFMGQNHYLGTFDSEWDAAAIYAWAHLILYGEEATRQAQKEGEEAAAAYEQEKKDIAAGKIPEPLPKVEKKKKPPVKKPSEPKKKAESSTKDGRETKVKAEEGADDLQDGEKPAASKKRKAKSEGGTKSEKKAKGNQEKKGKFLMTSVSARHKEAITPILTKGVSKAPILSRREMFENTDDSDLLSLVAQRIKAARESRFNESSPYTASSGSEEFRPCVPVESAVEAPSAGYAMLLGLSPSSSGWDLQGFVEANQLESEHETITALQLLAVEYDEDGVNEKFMSVMQGTVCVIGCADRKTQQAYQNLGLGTVPLGGTVGKLDCHVGGVPASCSEVSACIRYDPCSESLFKIACMAYDDIVTLNGQRLSREEGFVFLRNGDICSVGARVFSFIHAIDD